MQQRQRSLACHRTQQLQRPQQAWRQSPAQRPPQAAAAAERPCRQRSRRRCVGLACCSGVLQACTCRRRHVTRMCMCALPLQPPSCAPHLALPHPHRMHAPPGVARQPGRPRRAAQPARRDRRQLAATRGRRQLPARARGAATGAAGAADGRRQSGARAARLPARALPGRGGGRAGRSGGTAAARQLGTSCGVRQLQACVEASCVRQPPSLTLKSLLKRHGIQRRAFVTPCEFPERVLGRPGVAGSHADASASHGRGGATPLHSSAQVKPAAARRPHPLAPTSGPSAVPRWSAVRLLSPRWSAVRLLSPRWSAVHLLLLLVLHGLRRVALLRVARLGRVRLRRIAARLGRIRSARLLRIGRLLRVAVSTCESTNAASAGG